MQQPLSHLYFLTLLDNLTSDINSLLNIAGTITQVEECIVGITMHMTYLHSNST